MKPCATIPRTRARWTPLVAGLLLAFVGPACSSTSPRGPGGQAPSSQVGARDASYALATSADDLRRLLAEDLEIGDTDAVYSGLEAFVGENVTRRTTTRAHLIWEEVDPPTRLQFGRGRDVMTAIKELGNVLALASDAEMETAFESLRRGDFQEVQRLRDEPMGVFHPTTAAMSFEVRPYAMLADGVLSYRDLAAQAEPSSADVEAALDKLAAAQSELAKIGESQGMFLADAAAAQSLERAGQIDAAAEYWMRIADSPEFARQPEVMRNLVAARIKTYGVRMKERLILEVEQERRAEIRALDAEYDVKLSSLKQKHAAFDAWARAGFDAANVRMASLAEQDEAQRARIDAVAAAAETRDARLERATDRIAVELAEVADDTASLDRRVTVELREALSSAVSAVRADQDALAGEAADTRAVVAKVEASKPELSVALHDLAAYRTAVDELVAPDALADGAAAADSSPPVPGYLAMHAVPDVFRVESDSGPVAAFYVPADDAASR